MGYIGAMTLDHYMTTNKIDDEAMAKLVGKSAHGVIKWRRGVRIPRPKEMAKIVKITKGDVQPNDFYPATERAA